MANWILNTFVIPFIMTFINDLLTKENFEVYGDKLFDLIEDLVADSETKIDDKAVLPIINQLRIAMNIPDLPDKTE